MVMIRALALASALLVPLGAAPQATRVVQFQAQAMRITAVVRGTCWTNSIASRRADAFRCMTGNTIHDPCFTLSAQRVACPTNRSATAGVRFDLNKPLPKPAGAGGNNPWKIRLSDGTICNVGTGTIVAGYPFYCSGNLVCAAPATQMRPRAVSILCGTPKSSLQVTKVARHFVAILYE